MLINNWFYLFITCSTILRVKIACLKKLFQCLWEFMSRTTKCKWDQCRSQREREKERWMEMLHSLVAFFYGNCFFLRKMGHFGTSKASYMHIKSIISFAYCSILLIVIPLMEKACTVKFLSGVCWGYLVHYIYILFFNFGTIHSLGNNDNNEKLFHY